METSLPMAEDPRTDQALPSEPLAFTEIAFQTTRLEKTESDPDICEKAELDDKAPPSKQASETDAAAPICMHFSTLHAFPSCAGPQIDTELPTDAAPREDTIPLTKTFFDTETLLPNRAESLTDKPLAMKSKFIKEDCPATFAPPWTEYELPNCSDPRTEETGPNTMRPPWTLADPLSCSCALEDKLDPS
jgi:hypothetical protein